MSSVSSSSLIIELSFFFVASLFSLGFFTKKLSIAPVLVFFVGDDDCLVHGKERLIEFEEDSDTFVGGDKVRFIEVEEDDVSKDGELESLGIDGEDGFAK